MRRNVFVAVGLLAVALVAVLVVACSGNGGCKPQTLRLLVLLSGTSDQADTITVSDVDPDPALMFTQSFPHTPGDASAFYVDLTWPAGYPANKVVHMIVRATGGVASLGANSSVVHLDPGCQTATVSIFGNVVFDAGTTD